MKRVGGLFNLLWDRNALAAAFYRAAAGKRERPEVKRFGTRLDDELAQMSADLRAGTYSFAGYAAFFVRDTKSREIHAPSFRDRVAHHAIVGAAGPVFERGAMAHSYACRKGKGHHAALRQAAAWVRRDRWFLKIDVAKFYDSVPHALLRAALERRFRERRLLDLFGRLLASYESAPGRGIPIGALTSQYLGNFFLDQVDRCLLENAGGEVKLLRYMDDFLLIGARERLLDLRSVAGASLASLGLVMKHGGCLGRCALGVPWLGYTVYPDRLRLNREGKKRLGRRWTALEDARRRGELDEASAQARATALFAHAEQADDVAWRRALLARRRNGGARENFREALERPLESRDAWRLVEQPAPEVPLGHSQQEEADEPQPEPGLPPGAGWAGCVPRHGGAGAPPDDAPSGARCSLEDRDKPTDKPPAGPDIRPASAADMGGERARRGTIGAAEDREGGGL